MVRKIIASDIDGTLLPYLQKEIDPEIFKLIKKLKEEDVLFVPASGRTIQSLQDVFEPVSNEISYLSENGGVIWSGKTPIAQTPIPRKLLYEIVDTIYNNPEMECYITSLDQGFVYTDNEDFVDFFNENVIPNSQHLKSMDDLKEIPVKVTAWCDKEAEYYIESLNEQFGDRINIMQAGPNVIDFGIANKGYGLKVLTEYHNLTPKDVYAFGDNYNDKSMLEYAENSYIMRTDDPVLLNSAKYVCDNVLDELKKIYHNLKSSA